MPAPEAREPAQLSAHPNPFNPRTAVHFAVPVAGHVQIDAYDSSGRHVGRLFDERTTIGSRSMIWDGADAAGHPLPSGLYVLRLTGEGFDPASLKVVLLR